MNWWEARSYAELRSITGDAIVEESRQNGIFEITLPSWRLIDGVLYTMRNMSHAIFRGVEKGGVEKEGFRLEPSIFRGYGFRRFKTLEAKNEYIEKCFLHFEEAVRGRRGPLAKPVESYNPYELWSLGRHFGLKNTMLDWSHSPYVSLFFAFSDWKTAETRSLFCLKRNIIERLVPQILSDEELELPTTGHRGPEALFLGPSPGCGQLMFYKPLSDENFRMIHQQGLFTVSRSHNTVEEWVTENYGSIRSRIELALAQETDERIGKKLKIELESDWVLLKINIKTDQEDNKRVLRRLNRMNINHATLFPDIEGASLYANMQGDIHHY